MNNAKITRPIMRKGVCFIMTNILKTIKEVPKWEKVVIATLVVVPIPFAVGAYLGVRTIYKKIKNNTEK